VRLPRKQLIKKYLNTTHVKRETWIINVDPYCTHTIPKPLGRLNWKKSSGPHSESWFS
jgi:hypothetical protein